MRLHEACEKANEEDYLKETDSGIDFPKSSINSVSIGGITAASDKWEVILAGLKVVSVEEWFKKEKYNLPLDENDYHFEDMIMCATFFNVNGRLERNLELSELIDWCEENHSGHEDLFRIFKNLKPLFF